MSSDVADRDVSSLLVQRVEQLVSSRGRDGGRLCGFKHVSISVDENSFTSVSFCCVDTTSLVLLTGNNMNTSSCAELVLRVSSLHPLHHRVLMSEDFLQVVIT